MKTGVTGVVFLFIVSSVCVNATGSVNLSLGFNTQRMFGNSTFHIKTTDFVPEIGSDVKIESELEFPLDVSLVGGNVTLEGKLKKGDPWSINLGVSKNVNHPSGFMKDSDWITVPQYNFSSKFSYTESDAELGALLICLEGRLGIVRKENVAVDIVGGYEYQNFSFEIFGVRGWQGFDLSDRIYFDTLQSTNVIDYEVNYHIPYGGMATHLKFSPRVNLRAQAAFSPFTKASDHDDHLLRFKTGDSDCSGTALKGGAGLQWMVLGNKSESNWSLGAGFDYTKISTKGNQDQTWYGDDPVSPDIDDTGSKLRGIRQKITSSQISIHAEVSHSF